MTKPHATNPGVVRERRQKAAIERRSEKRAAKEAKDVAYPELDWGEWIKCPHCGQTVDPLQVRKCPKLLAARTDHRAVLLRQNSGPDLCAVCWSVVRTWEDGSYPVHAEPRDPRPPVLA